MYKTVSEAGHERKYVCKFRVESPPFLKNFECISIIFGGPVRIFCYDMIAEINNAFDGDDEIVFSA
jgi:hypothetical protein